MSRQDIKQMLIQYHLTLQQDVDLAFQCQNSPQRWQEYMRDWINQSRHHQFREALYSLGILKHQNADSIPILSFQDQFFSQISETPIKINNIFVSSINKLRWSQQLMKQIQQQIKQNIILNAASSQSMQEFLNRQISHISDILFRKASLKQYFDQIKFVNNSQSHSIFKLFNQMTFQDFIIALLKYCKDKGSIAKLLSQQRIPVPIVYQINQKIQSNEVIFSIIGMKESSVILNVGTPLTAKCGKTSLIAKIFSLNQNNITGTHLNNTVNLYTQLCFSEGRPILLDFNGMLSDKTSIPLLKKIQSYSNSLSLLIIHANQNEIIQDILNQRIYSTLLKSAQKVIIFVRDLSKYSEKVLQRRIPKYIKEKLMLFCLPNMQNSINAKHRQILTAIIQKSFNCFKQNTFSYLNYYENQDKQQIQSYRQMVKSAMQLIEDKDYNKRKIMPNMHRMEELLELQTKIKQQNTSEVKISSYKQRQRVLNSELKNPQLSQFISQCLQIFIISPLCKQILAEQLEKWKNANILPLRQSFLQLSNSLYEQKGDIGTTKSNIALNLQRRENYEISIDKIVYQLVLYNEVAKDKRYCSIISDFYNKSFREMSPVNLIDGKTLTFGNSALKDVIQAISNQYSAKQKKIFVVSVIGAQSSAKSTLLNFLFRCKFETSAGRCTKGIYMNLIEIDDMVLMVLDTEGLLSVSARDTAFDHQIASFILKISNIVIINNRGQLTTTLQQMLQVCLYVLQCLHIDQKQSKYHPQKIIFALRDQASSSQEIIQEEAANIKNSLQKIKNKSCFDYRNFFTIENDDIFSFPTALVELPGVIPKVGSIKCYDQRIFPNCILGLRNRMVKYLRSLTTQKKTLKQVYEQASRVWKAIQICGKDIMNFKTFNEITVKKSIQQRYNQQSSRYMAQIQEKYEDFKSIISNINRSHQLQSSEYRSRLHQIRRQMFNQITVDFTYRCNSICTNLQWIQEFYPKIQRVCACYEGSYIQQFDRKIANIIEQQKNEQLTKKLSRIIADLLSQSGPEQQILNKFKSDAAKIMEQSKNERQINKDKLKLQIMNAFQSILSLGKYAELKIYHIEDCYRIYKEIVFESSISKKVGQLFRFHHDYLKNSKDEQNLHLSFIKIFSAFQAKIKKQIAESKIKQAFDIYVNRQLFLKEIFNYLAYYNKIIGQINKENWVLQVNLYQPLHKIILFGKLYEILNEQIHQVKVNANKREMDQIESKMSRYESNLIRMLNIRGNAKQIIQNDIKNYIRELKETSLKQCKQIIQSQIGKLSLRLTPESIFSKAMNQTLLNNSEVDKKYYYINCFKMIKNINQYLYDKICESPQIATRSNTILYGVEQTLKSVNTNIQQMQRFLEESFDCDESKIRQSLNDKLFVGVANFQSQNISIMEVLQNLLKSFSETKIHIINQIKDALNSSHLQEEVLIFIKGPLRDKIIGCQSRCPICSMKCMLPKGHSQGHRVLQNCHSLAAFGNCSYNLNDEPILALCRGKDNITRQWIYKNKDLSPDLKSHVKAHYPGWQQDFPDVDEQSKFQTFSDKVKLHKIWANLQNVLIAIKFKSFKPTSDGQVKNLKDSSELTMDDLQAEQEQKLTRRRYKLKNY